MEERGGIKRSGDCRNRASVTTVRSVSKGRLSRPWLSQIIGERLCKPRDYISRKPSFRTSLLQLCFRMGTCNNRVTTWTGMELSALTLLHSTLMIHYAISWVCLLERAPHRKEGLKRMRWRGRKSEWTSLFVMHISPISLGMGPPPHSLLCEQKWGTSL